MIAKTEASGGPSLAPEVLAFSSSLALDRALYREDLVGSLAHLTMLARTRIIPAEAARAIREGLVSLWSVEPGRLPDEEDVHMAVEAELSRRIGAASGLLHTARSRNDQVALDLRLHVREQCAGILEQLADLLDALATRADAERNALMPSYTHRQRALPISFGYWLCGQGAMLARDVEAFGFVLEQADALPLGVGAIAGTTLPIDREATRALLGFSRLTLNGLDTVGDRDFALDYLYAAARCLGHLGRLSADVVDFASPEFGFFQLAGEIACGSSMMPQKRNPDVFELIRGKGGRALGNLTGLFTTLKGLPGGYNRDLQEDRAAVLETGPLVHGVLSALAFALPRVSLDRERCVAALDGDYTTATDLAEALVKKGVAFREAYQLIGALVRRCQEAKIPLARATPALAGDPRIDAEVLATADPRTSIARRESAGGTGPAAVAKQVAALRERAQHARARAKAVPRLQSLFTHLRAAAL